MKHVRTHGIVLRVRNGKNKDRIVTILTADRGKIVAVARGSRDMKSKNCSNAQEFQHISCQIYLGKGLPILTQTKLMESFAYRDLASLSGAAFIVETVEKLLEDEHHIDHVFPLMRDALSIITQKNYSKIFPFFTVKFLTILGYLQDFNRCGVSHLLLREVSETYVTSSLQIVSAEHKENGDTLIPITCVKALYFCQRYDLLQCVKLDLSLQDLNILNDLAYKMFYGITHTTRKSELFFHSVALA